MLVIILGCSLALVVLGLGGLLQLGTVGGGLAREYGILERVAEAQEVRRAFTAINMDRQGLASRNATERSNGLLGLQMRAADLRRKLEGLRKGEMTGKEQDPSWPTSRPSTPTPPGPSIRATPRRRTRTRATPPPRARGWC